MYFGVRAESGAIGDERKRERAKFHCSMPAAVATFEDGKFDEPAFRAASDGQISAGSRGLAPAGADAALVVTPHHNEPTREELYRHFEAVDEVVDIPILICNILPRGVVDMSVDRMKPLYELENNVGVKHATGDVGRVSRQRYALRGMCKIQLQMFRWKPPLPAIQRHTPIRATRPNRTSSSARAWR